MLKLIYDTVDAGAPSQYGNAIDVFRDEQQEHVAKLPQSAAGLCSSGTYHWRQPSTTGSLHAATAPILLWSWSTATSSTRAKTTG